MRHNNSDVTDPDKYRDWGREPESNQVDMLYEIAVQLERIADAMEDQHNNE